MEDQNSLHYPSLSPEMKAKVDTVVDLMFSQNPHNTHPLLNLLREEQREMVACQILGIK